jgi:hypothetical protein
MLNNGVDFILDSRFQQGDSEVLLAGNDRFIRQKTFPLLLEYVCQAPPGSLPINIAQAFLAAIEI